MVQKDFKCEKEIKPFDITDAIAIIFNSRSKIVNKDFSYN